MIQTLSQERSISSYGQRQESAMIRDRACGEPAVPGPRSQSAIIRRLFPPDITQMLAALDRAGDPNARNNRGQSLHIKAHWLAIVAFMAVYVASAISGASGYDTARDLSYAYAISHLQAFPLHGPVLGGALHLGPLWFYLLALPMALTESWLAVALFVAFLCSLQFPLAYAAGRRLIDRRFGLFWCAMLTLPGWGTFEVIGFGHTNVVRVASL